MSDDAITPILQALLACATTPLSPPPGRSFIQAGEVAWDDCCDGQVWVRLISMVPTGRPFPSPDSQQPGCGVLLWAATIGVGVVRCAHTLKEDGTAPTAAELTADAVQQAVDLAVLDLALRCCYPATVIGEYTYGDWAPLKVVNWAPLGPNGGCVGGEWTVVVAVPVCPCP